MDELSLLLQNIGEWFIAIIGLSHEATFLKYAYLTLPTSILLVLALILDWIIGDMRWLFRSIPHPILFFDKLITFLDKKLNRVSRSRQNRLIRGGTATFFIIFLAIIFGFIFDFLATEIPFFWLFNIWVCTLLLSGRGNYSDILHVAKSLKSEGVNAGRRTLTPLAKYNSQSLDEHGIIRVAIETLSWEFIKSVIAPSLFFLLFGLSGIIAYKALQILDHKIGYHTPQYQDFGMIAAKCYTVFNWLPSRLGGALIIIGAFFYPNANPYKAFKIMWHNANQHISLNAGWPIAAMAGAFDWALGGPKKYTHGILKANWIGQGTARLNLTNLEQALAIYVIANIIFAILLLMLFMSIL